MVSGTGIISASLSPLLQSIGLIIWGNTWKGSPFMLNLVKCSIASSIFLVVAMAIRSLRVDNVSFAMLFLSSFLGIILGDIAWLTALQIIGPRQVITFDTLKPFLGAILGHVILNETFNIATALGLIICALGIVIVVNETSTAVTEDDKTTVRSRSNSSTPFNENDEVSIHFDSSIRENSAHEHSFEDSDDEDNHVRLHTTTNRSTFSIKNTVSNRELYGYLMAIINVLFDSYGAVITKQYGKQLNTWEINLIRFGCAALVLILVSFVVEGYRRLQNLRWKSKPSSDVRGIQFTILSDNSNHPGGNIISNPLSNENIITIGNLSSDESATTDGEASYEAKQHSIAKVEWHQLPIALMSNIDWIKITIGVLLVTFISTALLNYALFQIDLGLCLTLTSLGPIYSIPLVYLMKNETTNIKAFTGAILTIIGIVVLCYANQSIKTATEPQSTSINYHDFEVYSLPGWYESFLPSRHYSGYINTSMNNRIIHTHFWFIESERNSSNDPLILFFNGGPGASSVYGNLVELGPFRLSGLSYINSSYTQTKIPQLIYNPYGWQSLGSLLFISMPAPVGYSFCTPPGPQGIGDACGSWNDTSSADLTYDVIKQWLTIFKPYRNRNMFITGESYAGIYIPMITERILANNNSFPINLKGLAIGNACTPPATCGRIPNRLKSSLIFLYGKAAYSMKLQEKIQSFCTEQEITIQRISSMNCQAALNQVSAEVGGYFGYSYYDDCWPNYQFSSPLSRSMLQTDRFSVGSESLYSEINSLPTYTYHTGIDSYPCGTDQAMSDWLDHSSVKSALNLPIDVVFYDTDDANGFPYNQTEFDIVSWYNETIRNTDLRILIYDGDTDPGINSFRSQNWTRTLKLKEIQSWRPWTTDNCQRMGGAVIRYEKNFDHLTIRGSGHMVPLYKPEVSLEFMTRFIRNEDYLHYDNCTDLISNDDFSYRQKAAMIEQEMLEEIMKWETRKSLLHRKLNDKSNR